MKVAVWADSGIGGTEKAASIFAVELARRGHQVDYLTPRTGARGEYLQQGGVRIREGQHEKPAFDRYLREAKPEVIHQHVPGYPIPSPIYSSLDQLREQQPALIETNIFGRFEDRESNRFVRHRMFVSRTSALQAFRRANRRLDEESLATCTVLNNPLLPAPPENLSERNALRAELGIHEDEVLAVRIGQRGPGKWTAWEAQAVQLARRQVPKLRLLLMEPPAEIQPKLVALGGDGGVMILRATADFARLNRIYRAADLMIHATYFGESFGYTIAEGMQAGLPVITRSTPWGDNAQVELVESGTTGFVCATVAEMARRCVELARDESRRREMGSAGQERISHLTDPGHEADVLEAVLRLVSSGQRDTLLDGRRKDLLDFAQKFPGREKRFSEAFTARPWEWLRWMGYRQYRAGRTAARRVIGR